MKLFAALLSAGLIVLSSCNDHTGRDNLLAGPPFSSLTDSIARSPLSASLYYRRGTLLYANNQTDYAEKDIRKAWQLSPKEPYALSLVTILKAKNKNSALLFLEEASRQLPASIALSIEQAKLYRDKDEDNKALQLCDNIIARYPANLDALVLKADILYDMDKPAEAVALLEKAYSYAPDDEELLHKLAFQYAEAKNPRVLALADTLIKANGKDGHADPYYFKGLYYENTGDVKKAVLYFNEAIQHDYNFLAAYMDKGQVLYGTKSYKEAAQTFRLALKVNPTQAEFYYWLAKTGEALGEKEEARLNYSRAFALDSSIKEAAEGMKRLL